MTTDSGADGAAEGRGGAPAACERPRAPVRTLALAFVLALTGAAVPGPMLALVIGQVLAQGIVAAALIVAGHALIETVFIACFAVGLSKALSSRKTRGALALVGGVALAWMGVDILVHVHGMSMAGAPEHALPWYGLVLGGIGVSLSNPYFTGWWATVGAGQVATLGLRSRSDYGLFFVGHELGDVAWFMFVACLLAFGKRWLSDSVYRGLLGGCGAAIVLLAVVFLTLGFRCLAGKPADGQ